jgi:hypothetical protein
MEIPSTPRRKTRVSDQEKENNKKKILELNEK